MTHSLVLIAAVLAHASGTSAPESWSDPPRAGALFKTIKAISAQKTIPRSRSSAPAECPAPIQGGKDDSLDSDCLGADAFRCGALGELCADAVPAVREALTQENSPLNPGFAALGPAGSTGKVDGPGSQGNGTFSVEKNDAYEVALTLDTGYIKGRITLKRDPATGQDTIRFAGRVWENGKLSEYRDKTHEAVIVYKAKDDEGTVRWTERGGKKSEDFWGGKSGRSMTIEFGGGYDHDFARD